MAQVKTVRLHDGDLLTLHILNETRANSNEAAFLAIFGDGSVVTWGHAAHGGDSSGVQDQLKNVKQIQANANAVAAIISDGSVVAWGDASSGGDSHAVQDQLQNVQQIQASDSFCGNSW